MGAIQDNLDKIRKPVEVSCKWCGQSKPEHTQWPVRSNYYQCKGELAPWVGCCFEPKPVETFCIDCGQPTTPGKGSARCPGCWEDRCGQMTEEEMQECRLDQQDEAERRGSTVCPHMREWLDCSECRRAT